MNEDVTFKPEVGHPTDSRSDYANSDHKSLKRCSSRNCCNGLILSCCLITKGMYCFIKFLVSTQSSTAAETCQLEHWSTLCFQWVCAVLSEAVFNRWYIREYGPVSKMMSSTTT